MSGGLRRAVPTALVYVLCALVIQYVANWVRSALLLPRLFLELLDWVLLAGFFLAVILAWYYPRLGHADDPPPDPPSGDAHEPPRPRSGESGG